MNQNGYDIGSVVDLRFLNKKREVAIKRRKFPPISQAEVKELMAYLQAVYPQAAA
jgi:hypothetical protein